MTNIANTPISAKTNCRLKKYSGSPSVSMAGSRLYMAEA